LNQTNTNKILNSILNYSKTLNDGAPVENRAAHEDHSIARDGGRRCVVNVVNLKDDLAVGGHRDTIPVGQSERLVVVQHRVEVLDPNGINWAIQHKPDMVSLSENKV